MKKRLARMRWQFIRFHILISLLTVLLTLIIFTYEESRGLLVVFDRKLLEIKKGSKSC